MSGCSFIFHTKHDFLHTTLGCVHHYYELLVVHFSTFYRSECAAMVVSLWLIDLSWIFYSVTCSFLFFKCQLTRWNSQGLTFVNVVTCCGFFNFDEIQLDKNIFAFLNPLQYSNLKNLRHTWKDTRGFVRKKVEKNVHNRTQMMCPFNTLQSVQFLWWKSFVTLQFIQPLFKV